jgi:hypothetical protein
MTLTTNRYLQTDVYTYTATSSCSICFDDTYSHNQNDPLFCHRTSCGHLFHTSCINRWYMNSTTCPCCRQEDTTLQLPLTDSSLNNPSLTPEEVVTNNEINNFINNILNNIPNNNVNYIINNNVNYIINNNIIDNRILEQYIYTHYHNNNDNNDNNNDNMILV